MNKKNSFDNNNLSDQIPVSDYRKKSLIKLLLFIFIIISFILIIKFTPVSEYANKDFLISSRGHLQLLSKNWWFSILFVLTYIAAVTFSFPALILSMAGGMIFGTFKGVLLNILGSNIGASLAFLMSRYLGREIIEKLLRGKLKLIDDSIEKNGFISILRLRLIPVVPFNLLNYASGFSKIKYKDYAFGTLIGMLPGTFIYTFFSDAILIDPNKQKEAFSKLIIAAFLLMTLSFVPNILKQIKQK